MWMESSVWPANMLRNGGRADRNEGGGDVESTMDISQLSWNPCCAIPGRLERAESSTGHKVSRGGRGTFKPVHCHRSNLRIEYGRQGAQWERARGGDSC